MAKFKTIHIDIYRRDITIFIGSHDEFKDWVQRYDVTDNWKQLIENIIESEDDALGAYWYNDNNGNGIIELPNHPETKEEIGVAAHECLHCVMRMLSFINIPCIYGEANEAYTYLLEYILVELLDYNNYEFID